MDQSVAAKEQPRYIKLNDRDNVAIVVNDFGLPAGSRFACGLTLRAFVPQGHKMALVDIAEGAPIIRYGEVIGHAPRADPGRRMGGRGPHPHAGGALRSTSWRSPPPCPPPLPPLEGYTFEGFRNADGSVGTKNILGISTRVQCVAGTMEYAVKRIRAELLPKYPNVDDVVALTHAYGCGVAIDAPDAVVPIRTLHNIALNPNFGGEVLVVSLGCEKLAPERLVPEGVSDSHRAHAGRGLRRLWRRSSRRSWPRPKRGLSVLNERRRETCPATDLVVGVQCGGSDAFSGVTANPAVGFAADLLVRAGATVMFSEVTEVRDAIHQLTRRAINEDVGRALIREMAWYDAYLARGGADRSANTTPGNKKGGLANIVEKAMGSIVKSGSSADLRRALARREGDAEGPALRGDAGERLHLRHAAARLRHEPAGLHHRPRHALRACRGAGDQGRDPQRAGAALARPDGLQRRPHRDGEATIEEIGWELFRLMLDVASGRTKTWAERWGCTTR